MYKHTKYIIITCVCAVYIHIQNRKYEIHTKLCFYVYPKSERPIILKIKNIKRGHCFPWVIFYYPYTFYIMSTIIIIIMHKRILCVFIVFIYTHIYRACGEKGMTTTDEHRRFALYTNEYII